jgi:hypothetical protein
MKSLVRLAIDNAASLGKTASNRSDAARWRLFGNRPNLNAASAASHVDALLSGAAEPEVAKGGRLHVRIAFHYVPWRLKYLKETIEAVSALPFEHIDIWVDTNSEQLGKETARLPGEYRIAVWDKLDHPFKLTWMHRGEMGKRLNDFDTFMYLEDDIIVPEKTMRRWLKETPRLAPLGLLPGFVRVEENRFGTLMLADYQERIDRSYITHVEGRPYLRTPYPYQACWVYDAAQMRELAGRPSFLTGAVEEPALFGDRFLPGMREQVAFGLQYTSVPDGYPSRVLVPLTDDLKIAPDALVFHSPSNYAQRRRPHPAGLGVVRVSDVFRE